MSTFRKHSYITGITTICNALNINPKMPANPSVRKSYELIHFILEDHIKDQRAKNRGLPSFVLSSPPKAGRATLLVYLLLHRLERRLPTAVQTCSGEYMIFDTHGGVNVVDDMDWDRLTDDCWALCDTNANLFKPCAVLRGSVVVLVQFMSEGYGECVEQKNARHICMDMSQSLEIAMAECGYC
ncbi:hypothetical protein CPB83DRAFT_858544 [Crepidotus variabilis]|uniref:Uncharacterized protein n=1 Tax=Crepidotus variabilis TaxID=179855 RepID=A0A9P6EAZ7_9AGAR|nr:hypothetical protein CPB83DRAFT_858544 [Crepidotus variabilis]